jgi:hypothetical protein
MNLSRNTPRFLATPDCCQRDNSKLFGGKAAAYMEAFVLKFRFRSRMHGGSG